MSNLTAYADRRDPLVEKLVSAGYSAESAERVVKFVNPQAYEKLLNADITQLVPVSVFRGMAISLEQYDPTHIGWNSMDKIDGVYQKTLWTIANLEYAVGFANSGVVVEMEVPKALIGRFSVVPATEAGRAEKYFYSFARNLIHDDRAFISRIGILGIPSAPPNKSPEHPLDPQWLSYETFFDQVGKLKAEFQEIVHREQCKNLLR